jgi:hypothetical protein
MSGLRKAFLTSLVAFLFASGCMTSKSVKNPTSPTIIPMTASPRSCDSLRQTLLKMAPVGTPASSATSWLESEGFTCQRTGANGQTIYATRTDQLSYWKSRSWTVICTLNQNAVVEFTVTE